MAACVVRGFSNRKVFNSFKFNSCFNVLKKVSQEQSGNIQNINCINVRSLNNQLWRVKVLRQLKKRQKEETKVIRPRSAFVNWNYSAEIFAFSRRLNEELTDGTLIRAFTHPSYIEKEDKERKELGASSETFLTLEDNSELVETGSSFMNNYIPAYLKQQLPYLPNDGTLSLHEYLISDDMLSYIAKNIGIPDLVLSADFPVEDKTLATSFRALIGAIVTDEGNKKAEKFVLDLVLTQLIGKDITEIWKIYNPMGTLRNVLQNQGKSEPESRLLRETGRNTLFSSFIVGLYVDKKLIGQGPGENLEIAVEMAALDALKNIYQIQDFRTPFTFTKTSVSKEMKNSQSHIIEN